LRKLPAILVGPIVVVKGNALQLSDRDRRRGFRTRRFVLRLHVLLAFLGGNSIALQVKELNSGITTCENNYLHSGTLLVEERFWKAGDNLAYQVMVHDPKVLTGPWTNFPHLIPPSAQRLEKSPVCKEDDGHRLLNLDNRLQR
jgi:hypothetical protein